MGSAQIGPPTFGGKEKKGVQGPKIWGGCEVGRGCTHLVALVAKLAGGTHGWPRGRAVFEAGDGWGATPRSEGFGEPPKNLRGPPKTKNKRWGPYPLP